MKRILIASLLLIVLLLTFSLPTTAAEAPLRALRAVRISPTEVVIEFSSPLDEKGIEHPYKALRRCNMSGGVPTGLAWDGETPLQETASGWDFYGDDRSRVVLYFDAFEMDAFLAEEGKYYEMGYRTRLCLEELSPVAGHDHKTLFDVVSQGGSALLATTPSTTGGWDAVYLKIDTDYAYDAADVSFAPETETPETTPAIDESGCAGTMSMAPALLLAACATLLGKKRSR